MAVVLQMWNDASSGRRLGIFLAVLVVLALTGLGFYWLLDDQEDVLFSGLEARDAAGIVRELERMKIEYRLADDGTTILVPAQDVHQTRLKLMGTGVPLSGGVGFEIFDNSDFGMTEFAQRINLQRALEGELTRTIMALDEIKYARVHLVMPDNGLFKQETREPTASVALFVKQGRNLDAEKVLGIQRLVSAAVPGLAREQVTVSDQNGVTLSKVASTEAGVEAVSDRLQKKAEVERYLVTKAIGVLEKAFGPNQALVSIDVTLDFSQSQITREEVIPSTKGKSDGVVRRRETRSGGEDMDAGGQNVSTETEYQLGRAVEQIVETPGQIRRMSVGVLVPDETPESRRHDIRRLIGMAIGVDEDRGDAIGVYSAAPVAQSHHEAEPSVTSAAANDAIRSNASAETGIVSVAPAPAATGVIAEENSEIHGWWADARHSLSDGVLVFLIVLTMAASVAFVLGVYALLRGSKKSDRDLTAEERERVLDQIKGWLELEPQDAGNEVRDARAVK